jgi:hypothetical protein
MSEVIIDGEAQVCRPGSDNHMYCNYVVRKDGTVRRPKNCDWLRFPLRWPYRGKKKEDSPAGNPLSDLI